MWCLFILVGASVSEPHIDEFAANFLYIYIYRIAGKFGRH